MRIIADNPSISLPVSASVTGYLQTGEMTEKLRERPQGSTFFRNAFPKLLKSNFLVTFCILVSCKLEMN